MYSDSQVGEMQDIVSKHGSAYGGLVADPVNHIVTVFVAPGGDAAALKDGTTQLANVGSSSDPLVSDGPKLWVVRTSAVGPSLDVLDRTAHLLPVTEPWWSEFGSEVVRYGADPSRHAVIIGMDPLDPTAVTKLNSFLSNVVAEASSPIKNYDRRLDSQPYKGGDFVLDAVPGNNCTAGFSAWDPSTGHQGLLVAGHCFGSGDTVSQGYYDSGNVAHTTGLVGVVTKDTRPQARQPDAAFVDAATGNSLVGPYVYSQLNYYEPVTNYSTSFIGESVCIDGATTGENCHAIIDSLQQCIWDNVQWNCQLTMSHSTDGSTLGQGGDSGGPTYIRVGGQLRALGLIKGGNSPSQLDYTEIGLALAWLNVGLVTTGGNLPVPQNLGDKLWPVSQVMNAGQYLLAQNGLYEAIFQGDGNFVLYSQSGPIWWSGTGTSGSYLLFQPDGNLVRYRQGGIYDGFSTGTQGNSSDWLQLNPDGHLVIYNPPSQPIWYRP